MNAISRPAAPQAAGVQLLALLCRFAFRLEQQDYEVLLQVRDGFHSSFGCFSAHTDAAELPQHLVT